MPWIFIRLIEWSVRPQVRACGLSTLNINVSVSHLIIFSELYNGIVSCPPPPKYVAEGYAFILLRLRSRGPKSGDFYSLRTLATEKNDQNGHVGPDLQIHNIVDTDIHRVSKNVPRLVCYNFDTLERI